MINRKFITKSSNVSDKFFILSISKNKKEKPNLRNTQKSVSLNSKLNLSLLCYCSSDIIIKIHTHKTNKHFNF